MNKYDKILILHALDKSTSFLNVFKDEFKDLYFPFDSEKKSIISAKELIGDLESKSLIIYLGHGSSAGLFEPDDNHIYEKYFLDVNWGNHFFEKHDIFLLCCKSNDYSKRLYNSNSSIGFGNIISSKFELDKYNTDNSFKLLLSENDIERFNQIYVGSCLKVIKKLLNDEIYFFDVPKHLRFLVNKEINHFLLNKNINNRLHISKILFDFRNQILFRKNFVQ